MGRRAKKAPVQTKKRVTLAKRFKCPFCANEDVVECQMKLREGTGSLNCRICGASFQMPIHHLHEPIDVFSEWLDACEAAEKGQGQSSHDNQGGIGGGATSGGGLEAELLGRARGTTNNKNKGGGRSSNDDGNTADDHETKKQAYASLGLGDSDDDSD